MSLLSVKNLSITFGSGSKKVTAVQDISYSVEKGEILGIVGESGSGKSVSSLAVMGLLDNNATINATTIEFDGTNLLTLSTKEKRKIIGAEIAMIFQDPMTSLDPCYTIGYQIIETLKCHKGGSYKQLKQEAIELLIKVGIHQPEMRMNSYPHQLSGGMNQRVMIAIAIACKPKLLIADEPTTALDVTIQKQIIDLLLDLQKQEDMTLIFISHDLALVAQISDRIIVMNAGNIMEEGQGKSIFIHPQHEYTKKLVSSLPEFHERKARISTTAQNKLRFSELGLYNLEYKSEDAPLLEVKNLKKTFQIKQGIFKPNASVKAVDDISFRLDKGKTLAVVGESGSGKSTLVNMITMILPPTEGEITYKGYNLIGNQHDKYKQIKRQKIQLVFQNPYSSLNPRKKIGSILEEPLLINTALSKDDRKTYVLDILKRVGLNEQSYERYPHMFSGGQRQRIAIARGLILQPDIVVADEPVSALDVTIRAQILDLMNDLQEELGLSYIFISHDLSVVEHIADEILVMYLGKCVEQGTTDQIFTNPQTEYTQNLLSAIPKLNLS